MIQPPKFLLSLSIFPYIEEVGYRVQRACPNELVDQEFPFIIVELTPIKQHRVLSP